MRTRFSTAAQASPSGSGVPSGKASWARTLSNSGPQRCNPRMIAASISASVANRSIGLLPGLAPRREFFPRDQRVLGLDLRSQRLNFFVSPLRISSHLVAVLRNVGDHGVDISQLEGVVSADHV